MTGIVIVGSGDWGGLERAAGFMLGSVIALVTGGTVGAIIRTEVWSDVSPVSPEAPSVAAQ